MRGLTIVESPYAGDIDSNVKYAREACLDCIRKRGERPFASHLFYTQMLDDNYLPDRELGISLGLAFWEHAQLIAFYTDLGWSRGMIEALHILMRYPGLYSYRPFVLRRLYGREPVIPPATKEVADFIERGGGFQCD